VLCCLASCSLGLKQPGFDLVKNGRSIELKIPPYGADSAEHGAYWWDGLIRASGSVAVAVVWRDVKALANL